MQDLDAAVYSPRTCDQRHDTLVDAATTCLLDFVAGDGSNGYWWNKEGLDGMGDSPARIAVDAAAIQDNGVGTWRALTWPKTAIHGLDVTVTVTVLYDGSDPATFSALT